MKIKRILVPVDFSLPSLEALEYAIELAEPLGARVDVLHVLEILSFAPLLGPSVDVDAVRRAQRHAAGNRLAKLQRDLERRHQAALAFELKLGNAHRIILDTAHKSGADLIVMATHGKSGLPRLFLGSVAEKVVRAANCPVLTIRAQKPSRVSRRRRGR